MLLPLPTYGLTPGLILRARAAVSGRNLLALELKAPSSPLPQGKSK